MERQLIFKFKTDISNINIPSKLNNPFGADIPEIAKIAAEEFQAFIASQSEKWKHDLYNHKGKMFGILVVQEQDNSYRYLGTVSGKLGEHGKCDKFIPSVFDDSVGDFFINKGMTEISAIGQQIKNSNIPTEISALREKSKRTSIALQQRLFENYNFLNLSGEKKNLLEIFKHSSHGNPPSAAGECAAPKLLHFAIQHQLKPIAIAEFWLGMPNKKIEMKSDVFYPACKNRCRPILEYMLEDTGLFERRN